MPSLKNDKIQTHLRYETFTTERIKYYEVIFDTLIYL
jgi:hypothetical protein